MLTTALVTLLFCAFASAQTLFGSRQAAPAGWEKLGAAPLNHQLTFILALKQQNLDALETQYWDRTNPQSKNYQKWMTIQEIRNIVSPPAEVKNQIQTWLKDAKVSQIRDHGDSLEVTASVKVVSELFQCKLHIFEHSTLGNTVSVWGTFSIPSKFLGQIEMISGINSFPTPNLAKMKVKKPVEKLTEKRSIWDSDTYVVPQTLYQMYSIPSSTKVTTNSSQGVIEWEQQYYSPDDLSGFATNMGVPSITKPVVVGQNFPDAPGVESTLDIQYVAATGLGAQNWFWIEAGTTWLYGFSVHFMSTPKVPMVASMSYGWNEEDQCENGIGQAECNSLGVNSTQYVARVNTEFMKIGLRGVSLFASSGDSGANGRTDLDCSDSVFHPAFPAASPYVTAVGATQIYDATFDLQNSPPVCDSSYFWWCAGGGTEQAVSYSFAGFASGGGFSNVAPMGAWQRTAVNQFLNSPTGKKTPTSFFNKNGRAFPDVAALGSQILIWSSGADTSVGGTSASCPIVAGIWALLNDYSIQKTGKPLGPANQLLYQMAAARPTAFTDVVVGDNVCTEDGCSYGCNGFYAGPGWDPVTGLGTPVYTEMLAYLKSIL